jgi:hypothetical protein
VVEDALTSKASQGKDVDIEETILGQYASAFHFHATLASVLGPTLVRDRVVADTRRTRRVSAGASHDERVRLRARAANEQRSDAIPWRRRTVNRRRDL